MDLRLNARKLLAALLVAGLVVAGGADAFARGSHVQFKAAISIRVENRKTQHEGRVHVFVNRYLDYKNGVAQRVVEVPIETVKLASSGVHTLTVPVTGAVRKAAMHGQRRSSQHGVVELYFIGDFGQTSCVSQQSEWVLRTRAMDAGSSGPVKFGSCQKVG